VFGLLLLFVPFVCSFPGKFERFGPLYIPPHKKQAMRKNNLPAPVDASKMCPLEMFYDADVHEAVANLRILDGDIPVHPQYGMPVNFFAPQKSRKFWTKSSTPELGYFSLNVCIISIMVIIFIIDIYQQIFPLPRSGQSSVSFPREAF
jgi:hypothetical protein